MSSRTTFAIALALCTLLPGLVPAAAHRSPQAGAPAISCPRDWQIMDTQNPGTSGNSFWDITAVAHHNLWAVGYAGSSTTSRQTLIEHYDGTQWTVVTSPNLPGYPMNQLTGVSAVSATDIWAAGFATTSGYLNQALLAYYDGDQWALVATPALPDSDDNFFTDVVALDTDDVWIVGAYRTTGTGSYHALVEHYDGAQWSIFPTPGLDMLNADLEGLTAIAPDDLWAVGNQASGAGGTYQTLIVHYDGSGWEAVDSPSITTGDNILHNVAFADATHGWAVGRAQEDYEDYAIVLFYDGGNWTVASRHTESSDLWAVTAPGVNDVWAGGFYGDSAAWSPFLDRWNGAAWIPTTLVSNPGSIYNLTRDSSGYLYAVGNTRPASSRLTLVAEASPECQWSSYSYLPLVQQSSAP